MVSVPMGEEWKKSASVGLVKNSRWAELKLSELRFHPQWWRFSAHICRKVDSAFCVSFFFFQKKGKRGDGRKIGLIVRLYSSTVCCPACLPMIRLCELRSEIKGGSRSTRESENPTQKYSIT